MDKKQKDKVAAEYIKWRDNDYAPLSGGVLTEMDERMAQAFVAGYNYGIQEVKKVVKEHLAELEKEGAFSEISDRLPAVGGFH